MLSKKPVVIRLNDWMALEATKKKVELVAVCEHRSANPPIKAVQMKIHKALRSEAMPYFELWHESSKPVETEELLNFEGNREPRKVFVMAHRFHLVILRGSEK